MKGFEGPGSERDQARFFAKVALPNEQGCMLWMGTMRRDGYGSLCVNYERWLAHRFSYSVFNGSIPDGLVIDHLCRNKRCVAPDHLEAVTQAENMRRGNVTKVRSAQQRAKTHCPSGHPYDEANTYVNPNGGRACRACARGYMVRKRALRRAQC